MRDFQPVTKLKISQLCVLPVQLELRRFRDAHGKVVARVALFHRQHDPRLGQVQCFERAARRDRSVNDHVHRQIGLLFVHVQLDVITRQQLFQLNVVLRVQQEDALLARHLERFERPRFEVLYDELILVGDHFADEPVRLVKGLLASFVASHEEHRGRHEDRCGECSHRDQSPPPSIVGGCFFRRVASRSVADQLEINLQIGQSFVGRLVSQRGVFLRELLHDLGHIGRNPFQHAVDLGQLPIGRGVPHHPRELLIAALRVETRKEIVEVLAAHQVIRSEAERIEIALRTHFSKIIGDRFGGHVLGRPFEQAALGIGDAAGESEVAELHAPPRVNHQVRGLDISVNDALCVQILQRPQRMREQRPQRPEIDLPPSQPRREAALHQLHHEPAPLAHDVEDRDDVWMLERRE